MRLTELATIISEFTGEGVQSALEKLERELFHPGVTVAEAWHAANPKTVEEITAFYRTTDAYIYDLMVDHQKHHRLRLKEEIRQRLRRGGLGLRVLDYGGGIGIDSAELSEAGFVVTYFEMPGRSAEFAQWRFGQLGLADRICVVHEEQHLSPESFDAIVCIEVLEHLSEPFTLIGRFREWLREGGLLLVTASFSLVGDEYPCHLPENAKYAYRFIPMVERMGFIHHPASTPPMEFVKVKKDVRFKLRVVASRWLYSYRFIATGLKKLIG